MKDRAILLVDDETIYLQYLSRIIDWEELQCGICGFAKDGEEALVLIREKHPDIVFISDISGKSTRYGNS